MSFQLKSNKQETDNKTIRFPIKLIEKIEKVIEGTDLTFSRFVIQACEFALDNLDNKENKKSSIK
jgi:hypothetical protein